MDSDLNLLKKLALNCYDCLNYLFDFKINKRACIELLSLNWNFKTILLNSENCFRTYVNFR